MFDPFDNNMVLSVGKNHVFFWDILGDEAIYDVGDFCDYEVPDYVTCLGFGAQNTLVTADSNAYVHVWDKAEKHTISVIKTNHTGSIITMQVLSGDNIITGGGSDRMLTLISHDQMIPNLNQAQIPERFGGIVAVAPVKSGFIGTDYSHMKFVIGTSMNSILCGTMESAFDVLVNGTSAQMSAVAAHPTENTFVTAGEDSCVVLWNAEEHVDVWETDVDSPCTAVAFHPAGDIIVVGTDSGRWVILNAADSNPVASFQCDRMKISCMSYSPEGNALAIGTESGAVFLYHCYDDGRSYRYVTTVKVSICYGTF